MVQRVSRSAFLTIFFLSLFLFLHTHDGWAFSCLVPHGKDAIEQYPVIFKGVAQKSETGEKTVFKVWKLYKGDLEDNERVGFIQEQPENNGQDKARIFFLDASGYSSPCTPGFSLTAIKNSPDNLWAQAQTLAELEIYKASSFEEKIQAFDQLINELPNVYHFYLKRAQFFEEAQKYDEALEAYKLAVAKKYQTWIKAKYGDKGPGGDLGRYNHLLGSPMEIPHDAVIHGVTGGWHPMLGYARVLDKLGRYTEALKVLELINGAASSKEAEALYVDVSEKLKAK